MVSDGRLLVGVTGGIGSGKSYFCRILESMGFPVFDTDTAARREMLENEGLRRRLRKLVSPEIFKDNGSLNKPVIRKFLHTSEQNAARFDAVVHPCVREAWRRWAESRESHLVFMECALLYEAHFDNEVDFSVLVSAPEEVRVERVMERDGIPAHMVRKWMAMQLAEDEKARRADFVVHNDGETDMREEARRLVALLTAAAKNE